MSAPTKFPLKLLLCGGVIFFKLFSENSIFYITSLLAPKCAYKGVNMLLKKIKGFSGYLVSDTGLVFSGKQKGVYRPLVAQANTLGYLQVALMKKGKRSIKLVSRLVADAFVAKLPKKGVQGRLTASHIDGNPLNNNAYNLAVESLKVNIGRRTEPSKRPRLTEAEVYQIKDYRKQGLSLQKVVSLTGRSMSAVIKATKKAA